METQFFTRPDGTIAYDDSQGDGDQGSRLAGSRSRGPLYGRRAECELAMIDDAGHYPQTEMPEKVTPVILDFLKEVN